MGLTPGQRLGVYAIVSPLGAGGMGEVWRATDTRLGREVATQAASRLASPPIPIGSPASSARRSCSLRCRTPTSPASSRSRRHCSKAPRRRCASSRWSWPRRGSRRAPEAGRDPRRRVDRDREADRRGARGCPREGHRPPRPQAREREGVCRGPRQGPRLRPGQGMEQRWRRHRGGLGLSSPPSHAPALPRASSSARPPTCRPSRRAASPWTNVPTSGPSAWCCSRC